MVGLIELLVLGGGALLTLLGVGAFFAWKAGDRLQRGSSSSSATPARSGNLRFASIDKLFADVRAKVAKLDDPELIATLGKHLDDLNAKKEASADRLEDLEPILRSSMGDVLRQTKLAEQASLIESVESIATGLREMKDRLTGAPDAGEVAKGIAASLSALHGELDSQERARREIAALEQKNS